MAAAVLCIAACAWGMLSPRPVLGFLAGVPSSALEWTYICTFFAWITVIAHARFGPIPVTSFFSRNIEPYLRQNRSHTLPSHWKHVSLSLVLGGMFISAFIGHSL